MQEYCVRFMPKFSRMYFLVSVNGFTYKNIHIFRVTASWRGNKSLRAVYPNTHLLVNMFFSIKVLRALIGLLNCTRKHMLLGALVNDALIIRLTYVLNTGFPNVALLSA